MAESLLRRADIESVADAAILRMLLAAVEGHKEGSPEWQQALASALAHGGIMKNRIRRFRVHVAKTPSSMIGVVQPDDKGHIDASPFKFYELNGKYRAEIFCTDKGKKAGQWQCDFVANWRQENPTARLIMRLRKSDMVAYEKEGHRVISRVKKLGKGPYGGLVFLLPHKIVREEVQHKFGKLPPTCSR